MILPMKKNQAHNIKCMIHISINWVVSCIPHRSMGYIEVYPIMCKHNMTRFN